MAWQAEHSSNVSILFISCAPLTSLDLNPLATSRKVINDTSPKRRKRSVDIQDFITWQRKIRPSAAYDNAVEQTIRVLGPCWNALPCRRSPATSESKPLLRFNHTRKERDRSTLPPSFDQSGICTNFQAFTGASFPCAPTLV